MICTSLPSLSSSKIKGEKIKQSDDNVEENDDKNVLFKRCSLQLGEEACTDTLLQLPTQVQYSCQAFILMVMVRIQIWLSMKKKCMFSAPTGGCANLNLTEPLYSETRMWSNGENALRGFESKKL